MQKKDYTEMPAFQKVRLRELQLVRKTPQAGNGGIKNLNLFCCFPF